ncbi:UNVERIFIED_CONTAM: hypothetical protein GTU68_005614 [Idotea baltica]|nr:hypothetical protein [Idotea baltica]
MVVIFSLYLMMPKLKM